MNFELVVSLSEGLLAECNCAGSVSLREKLRNILGSKANDNNLTRLRAILIKSNALSKTHQLSEIFPGEHFDSTLYSFSDRFRKPRTHAVACAGHLTGNYDDFYTTNVPELAKQIRCGYLVQGKVIEFSLRERIDVRGEELARLSTTIHCIYNDDFRWFLVGKYGVKEYLSN